MSSHPLFRSEMPWGLFGDTGTSQSWWLVKYRLGSVGLRKGKTQSRIHFQLQRDASTASTLTMHACLLFQTLPLAFIIQIKLREILGFTCSERQHASNGVLSAKNSPLPKAPSLSASS